MTPKIRKPHISTRDTRPVMLRSTSGRVAPWARVGACHWAACPPTHRPRRERHNSSTTAGRLGIISSGSCSALAHVDTPRDRAAYVGWPNWRSPCGGRPPWRVDPTPRRHEKAGAGATSLAGAAYPTARHSSLETQDSRLTTVELTLAFPRNSVFRRYHPREGATIHQDHSEESCDEERLPY